MLRKSGEAFERVVVRNVAKGGTPQISTEALNAPDDAASLEVERRPLALRLKGSTADESNRPD